MDTLSETADKVDQGLQNMGLDGTSVKQSLKDILNFKEYLTEQAKEEECSRIYEEWKGAADITFHQDVLDRVEVKTVMKDLL